MRIAITPNFSDIQNIRERRKNFCGYAERVVCPITLPSFLRLRNRRVRPCARQPGRPMAVTHVAGTFDSGSASKAIAGKG
jgi:hypothetical protein